MERLSALALVIAALACASRPQASSQDSECANQTFAAVTNHWRGTIDVYTDRRAAAAGSVTPGTRVEFPVASRGQISFRPEGSTIELPRDVRSRIQVEYICR